MESARTISRPGTIRWDRVARIALLLVLAGVLALYVNPALSWLATWRQANHRRAEVRRLKAENASLLARRRALSRSATIERAARDLGMVKRGERAYVFENLPAGR